MSVVRMNDEIMEEMRARKELIVFIKSLDGLDEIEIKDEEDDENDNDD